MFSSLRKFHPLRVAASAGLKGALPKVLVGAALLGGGGSVLSAGSAQAASCGTLSSPITCTEEDKTITELVSTAAVVGLGGSTAALLEFPFPPPGLDGDEWTFEVTTLPTATPGLYTYMAQYKIAITNPLYFFDNVEVDSDVTLGVGGTTTIVKDVFSDASFGAPALITTITSTNGSEGIVNLPGHYQTLWIKDTVTANATGGINNWQNSFGQKTKVPGPLPLLGAGMAFGFSRKLRSRIKARVQA